jgi:sulfonate transport system permease protein
MSQGQVVSPVEQIPAAAPPSVPVIRREASGSRRSAWLWRLGSVAAMIVIWEVLSLLLGKSSSGTKYIPGIVDTARAFKAFAGYWPGGLGAGNTLNGAPATAWGAVLGLIYNTGVSLLRVLIGYVGGVVVGVGLALLVSWSRAARQIIILPAYFARMAPLLAMLPLFGLWFGDSEFGVYVFTAFAVAVLLFMVTLTAVGGVPPTYHHYAASLGASDRRIYATVVIPSIMPELSVGLLMAVPFAWSAVLASEILGGTYGLGRILNFALQYAATNTIAATGLVVVVIAAVSYYTLRRLMRWLTRWS